MKRSKIILLVLSGALIGGAILRPDFIPGHATRALNGCISNLKYIDGVKEHWAMVNKAEAGAVVRMSDLTEGPRALLNPFPKCAAGGTYRVGLVGENPECTVKRHSLDVNEVIGEER
ncbi:MAG TPA: hypothetical protein VF773_03220 [Verrucomicrobiae bacterium]